MAQDPAFLFYPGDWNLGTMHLTLLEKGCYMELLVLQFAKGKFTEAQAKHMLNGSFDLAWPNIVDKFDTDGTFFWNKRLNLEKERRQKFTDSRKSNGSVKKSLGHMPKRMEDENEDCITSSVILPLISKEDLEKFRLKLMDDQILIPQIISSRGIGSMSNLISWIDVFNIHILGEGKAHKDYSDYKRHFKNWIMKQNTFGAPPQTTASVKKMVV